MVATSISEQLHNQSILVVEATIPAGVTIAEWRRRRPVTAPPSRFSRAVAGARRILGL